MPEDNSHAGQGAVVLDIGGDIGALIVSAPAELDGVEIEIRPTSPADPTGTHGHHHDGPDAQHDHEHRHLLHVAVLGRPANGRILHTAVFGELSTGSYELYRRDDGAVELTVSVRGGEVTYASWPS